MQALLSNIILEYGKHTVIEKIWLLEIVDIEKYWSCQKNLLKSVPYLHKPCFLILQD